ncbi:FHA domain-containing protein [Cryobacterium zhongshanensis]|uniref:FHA domain-containing protein n=1 Tax=Cryobacterium zhongshanensis TaxID=2928153 RepID=A0AA41UKR6_9MICO|nr:FHA domain-containing protein [Cryobacterium zhongshanensis]MCI4658191.1 FHA domain-containing protein [Cryobacterium zhongshanensis]
MRHYSPGSWLGFVTDSGLVMLPGDISSELLDRIWGSLNAGQGLGALLEALTGSFGTSLAALPDFVIVSLVGSEARIAVRGPLQVRITGDSDQGDFRVTGARVTTWSESVAESPASIEVITDTAATPVVHLPIGSGVVLCSGLSLIVRAPSVIPLEELAASLVDTLDPGPASLPAPAESLAEARIFPETARGPKPVPVPEPEPEPATEPAPEHALVPEPVPEPRPEPVPIAMPPAAPTSVPAAGDPISLEDHTLGLAYDGLWGAPPRALIEGVPTFAPAAPVVQDRAAAEATIGATGVTIEAAGDHATDDDHDGETLSIEQIRALGLAAPASVPAAPALPTEPRLPGQLRVVHDGIPVRLDVALDRGAVIGRKPSAGRFSADRMPHLITVPSPEQDISRSHLEIRCEGMHVFAIDLQTTNGTRLLRAGSDPVRLDPQEPAMLVHGDVLDLGDAVLVTFEALS